MRNRQDFLLSHLQRIETFVFEELRTKKYSKTKKWYKEVFVPVVANVLSVGYLIGYDDLIDFNDLIGRRYEVN